MSNVAPVFTTSGFADFLLSVPVLDICLSKARLAAHNLPFKYLNPKYNHSSLLLPFQFSSYPFNFTFISCLYTGQLFFLFFFSSHKTIIYLTLPLPPVLRLCVPRASQALFILSFRLHLNFFPLLPFFLTSSMTSSVYFSFWLLCRSNHLLVWLVCLHASFMNPYYQASVNYTHRLRRWTHTHTHNSSTHTKPSLQSLVAFHQKAHFLIPD